MKSSSSMQMLFDLPLNHNDRLDSTEDFQSLCIRCCTFQALDLVYNPTVPRTDNRQDVRIELGTLDQVRYRQACPCCRLVERIVRDASKSLPILDILSIERGCLILTNDHGLISVSTTSGLTIGHFTNDKEDPASAFLNNGGLVPKARSRSSVVRWWINNCDVADYRTKMQADTGLSGSLLVDVRDRCLVKLQKSFRYAALSYVRGGVSTLTTTKANLATLQMPGSLQRAEKDVGRLVWDLMKFVQKVGLRYVWVDCLCIVQDDPVHKQSQVHVMDQIYGTAYCTIAVLDATNVDAGLPGLLRNAVPGLTERMLPPSYPKPRVLRALPTQLLRQWDSFAYETRAWTFQERLLSHRCLYITRDGLYFNSSSGLRCEGDPSQTLSHPWSRANIVSNPLMYLEKRRGIDKAKEFLAYSVMLAAYSSRQLSYPCDVLSAFTGILSHIKQHRKQNFVCGLPGWDLETALLWIPLQPMNRREVSDPQFGPLETIFPSWSWAGWEGTVSYIVAHKRLAVNSAFEVREPQAVPPTIFKSFWTDANAPDRARTSLALRVNSNHLVPRGKLVFGDHIQEAMNSPSTIISYQKLLDSDGWHCGVAFGLDYDPLKDTNTQYSFLLLSKSLQTQINIVLPTAIYSMDWTKPEVHDSVPVHSKPKRGPGRPSATIICHFIVLRHIMGRQVERVGVGFMHGHTWSMYEEPYKKDFLIY